MRTVMVMFDTLTRKYLPNYGNEQVYAPNFQRLAEKCTTFNNFYAGSLPCMPARRELHTGKYNFLHRGWGPLEPFDRSAMEVLKTNGIYTHLVTDHSHYWEDGGCTYHNRYDTWEGFRGQEGDRYVPHDIDVTVPEGHPLNKKGISVTQHYCNRTRQTVQEEMPSVKTFAAGLEFLENHAQKDNWFVQIEAFDPHEPFYVPQKFRAMYGLPENETLYWPRYGNVPEDRDYHDDLELCHKEYAALISMCDESLGRVLDFMDEHDMWKDTALIVNTDHGFLLGEHEYLGKNFPPCYDELVHTPFFLHVPGAAEGGQCDALCSTVDLVPTLLDLFGCDKEPMGELDGKSILPVLKGEETPKDHVLFGLHGHYTCWTDGRIVYMKNAVNDTQVYEYTMMPTNIRGYFSTEQLKHAELVNGGRVTNGLPCMKMPMNNYYLQLKAEDHLYDLSADPEEANDLIKTADVTELNRKLHDALADADAPEEEFRRLGI